MWSGGLVLVGASYLRLWCAAAALQQLTQDEQPRTARALRSLQRTRDVPKIDVSVNGEPKSGTTWLQFILWEVLREWCGHADGCQMRPTASNVAVAAALASGEILTSSNPYKHIIPHIGHAGGIDGGVPPTVSEQKMKAAAATLVKEMQNGTKYAVIFRDPRDVAISACHYHPNETCGEVQELPAYVQKIMGSLSGWINLRYRLFRAVQSLAPTRVGLFFYEDMLENGPAAIETVANLFEIGMAAAQVEAVLNKTSFSAMHEQAAKQLVPGGTKKMRSGHACGFKEELQDDVARAVTTLMRSTLLDELSDRWHC